MKTSNVRKLEALYELLPVRSSNPVIRATTVNQRKIIRDVVEDERRDDSALVLHARSELERLADHDSDPDNAPLHESLVDAVRAFASFGHSGGTAEWARETLDKLLRMESLTPLTANQSEWINHGAVWQSKRDPNCVSHDNLKSYYKVSELHQTGDLSLTPSYPLEELPNKYGRTWVDHSGLNRQSFRALKFHEDDSFITRQWREAGYRPEGE